MKSAREVIFKRLRGEQSRRANGADAPALDARIRNAPSHTRPRQGEDLLQLFTERFCARGGSIDRLGHANDIVPHVLAYLADNQLPPQLVLSDSLPQLSWPADVSIKAGPAQRQDLVALSACVLAVAETGSLMFCSGPESPTTHNFVPDHHIVILRASTVVAHLEDAWSALRQRSGGMPRAVNFVAGPSRTGDIEQTIQLGAHGPRRVHVLLQD